MVFITFSFYSPSADYFVNVDMMVEFFISGYVHPTYLNIVPFKANIFELNEEKTLQACDVFRLFLCLYVVFMVYRKLVSLIRSCITSM